MAENNAKVTLENKEKQKRNPKKRQIFLMFPYHYK